MQEIHLLIGFIGGGEKCNVSHQTRIIAVAPKIILFAQVHLVRDAKDCADLIACSELEREDILAERSLEEDNAKLFAWVLQQAFGAQGDAAEQVVQSAPLTRAKTGAVVKVRIE